MPINTSNADFGEQINNYISSSVPSILLMSMEMTRRIPGVSNCIGRLVDLLGRQRDEPGRDACRRESEAGRLVLSDESV